MSNRLGFFASCLSVGLLVFTGCGRPHEGLSEVEADIEVVSQVSFGSVVVGQPVNQPLLVANSGSFELQLESFRIVGNDAFTHNAPDDLTVDPSGQVTINLRFQPAVEGALEAVLVIRSNDPDEDILEIELTGQGVGGCVPVVWYRDADGDGQGDPLTTMEACTQPSGYVAAGNDCNDSDPGECTCTASIWYRDQDLDGFGDATQAVSSCEQPPGYVADDTDCNDGNFSVNPTGVESGVVLCDDGLDNDCDAEPDSFDTDCAYTDCGDAADAYNTLTCNPEYPNTGPMLCEEYPESPLPEGQREQCMSVCRTRNECAPGLACYPSRRSLNLHFCAPVLGEDLAESGESCALDTDCVSAACHDNVCREVCVRDADCGGGNMICRAEIRTHAYIGTEIATGICVPRNVTLLPNGAMCGSGALCQSGVCSQAYAGGDFVCSKPCGSFNDCSVGERCAPAVWDNNPLVGYGFRTCGPIPAGGIGSIGQSCYFGGKDTCQSFFCDTTYYLSDLDYVIEPYCNGHCDNDSDCPLLLPSAYGIRMRCSMATSDDILPLVGGYCTPWWCESITDCPVGSTECLMGNTERWGGLPPGFCR